MSGVRMRRDADLPYSVLSCYEARSQTEHCLLNLLRMQVGVVLNLSFCIYCKEHVPAEACCKVARLNLPLGIPPVLEAVLEKLVTVHGNCHARTTAPAIRLKHQ
jgi:hypothetical protein